MTNHPVCLWRPSLLPAHFQRKKSLKRMYNPGQEPSGTQAERHQGSCKTRTVSRYCVRCGLTRNTWWDNDSQQNVWPERREDPESHRERPAAKTPSTEKHHNIQELTAHLWRESSNETSETKTQNKIKHFGSTSHIFFFKALLVFIKMISQVKTQSFSTYKIHVWFHLLTLTNNISP